MSRRAAFRRSSAVPPGRSGRWAVPRARAAWAAVAWLVALAVMPAGASAAGDAGAAMADAASRVPPHPSAGAPPVAPALALSARQAAQSRLHYLQHCMGCHLPDGRGAPEKGIPSMQGTLGRFLAVPGGREFIVQVPGVMNAALGDAEVAQLMNWLLPQVSAATVPPDTAAYTAGEIARLRQTRPLDVPAARAALVAKWPGGTP